MWKSLAKFVIKNRIVLLVLLLLSTCVMGYFASKVKPSYEFSRAIPADNPKYLEYVSFKQKFGDDGNVLVAGISTDAFFTIKIFNDYVRLQNDIKKIRGVENILSVPNAFALSPDSSSESGAAIPQQIFPGTINSQTALDSGAALFATLPFYDHRLYNRHTNSYLVAVRINKNVLASKERSNVIAGISGALAAFKSRTHIETHISGLPLIRTMIADRIQKEMKVFLLASLALSILILLLFFRSLSTTLLSIFVVLVGVIWTIATIYLCGYQISLLTALIPSLVIVIGIPNCIYFINKYHASYIKDTETISRQERKINALVSMVSSMGVVTLFCNLTAAIGFAVFAFTKSAILKEFGVVAGISIMVIFVVSFIMLPSVLSLLPAPGTNQLKYLKNKAISYVLDTLEKWVFNKRRQVIIITSLFVVLAGLGIMRLKTVAYIADDLPKKDKIYTDLKYFEKNFKGVMPLEILIDAGKPNGIRRGSFDIRKVEQFQDSVLAVSPEIGQPLSVIDAIKFFYQGASGGNDSAYALPFAGNPLEELHKKLRELRSKQRANELQSKDSAVLALAGTFIDSTEQYMRISVSMADIGTEKLPLLLERLTEKSAVIFDSSKYFFTEADRTSPYKVMSTFAEDSSVISDTVFSKTDTIPQYKVTLTGTSITFLEGSRFIIDGLKESIFWAFVLIALCMLFLFRSLKILLCSLIPNIIPLLITAGIMGWTGVPLKPSTVLIFSVAMGIAIDITIRFLVNYKQVLPQHNNDVYASVRATIHQTGLSIIYTSLVLTAGFIIFCASSFGGTFALGWLTSVTLLSATITNLVLLPVLLLLFAGKKNRL